MKPRFVLRSAPRLVARQQPLEQVVAYVKAQSTAPLLLAENNHAMRPNDRMSDSSDSVLRRQVIRAYGSLGVFSQVVGISPAVTGDLFKGWVRRRPDSEVARIRAAFGLPTDYS